MSEQELPEAEVLLGWVEAGDEQPLDALEARLAAGPAVGDEGARWSKVRGQLDRPVAPDGLPDAVVDQLHHTLSRPRRVQWLLWPASVLMLGAALAASTMVWVDPGGPAETSQGTDPSGMHRGDGDVVDAQGPALQVAATVSAGTVQLTVDVGPGPEGVPVAPGSLRVVLLRGDGVDVTDQLDLPDGEARRVVGELALPAGVHALEVSVSDVEGHRTVQQLEVRVP